MKTTRIILVILFGILLIACDSCGPVPCQTDQECVDADISCNYCSQFDECVECTEDGHCKSGNLRFCFDNICRECLEDNHCYSSHICEDYKCVAVECTHDGDCPVVCIAGRCEECRDNQDCPDGEACDPRYSCVADSCPEGQKWCNSAGLAGDCIDEDKCCSDRDCTAGVPPPWCLKSTGECVECMGPEDCDSGETCQDNNCVTA